MIRQIRGTVLELEAGCVIIDVAGWGTSVHVMNPLAFTIGSEVSLRTHMTVKQDGIDLYGFESAADLRFFEQCLTVSGVGPKTALSFLVRASRESLEQAIGTRDVTYLTRVVGLGKKAAEKLIIELSEKVAVSTEEHRGDDAEVFDTLVALGYTDREARKAVADIPMHVTGRDARLKAALSGAS
jgi:Holliday junction DNA helicase RuvA